MNTDKPKAIRKGNRITHYTYRGIHIDRWVNDRGYFIGHTAMYQAAGTKFDVTYISTRHDGKRSTERVTYSTLAGAVAFIDRWMRDSQYTANDRGQLVKAATSQQ